MGIVGIITSFNFPHAVIGWNFCLSFVCGNCTVWKGASTTSMVTIATAKIIHWVLARMKVPPGVFMAMVAPGQGVGE